MTPIPLKIHDGELRNIAMPGDSTVTLSFETIDKKMVSLTLEGVTDFRCDALLAGNIISGAWQIDEPTLDHLNRVTCRESQPGARRPPSEKDRRYLQEKLEAVQRGDLAFISLESSYGCVIDALCRSYQIA